MIDAYIITMSGHQGSMEQAQRCRDSSVSVGNNFPIHHFEATVFDTAEAEFRKRGIWHENFNSPQKPNMPACTMSHLRLWEHVAISNRPALILEHDAVFRSRFDRITYGNILTSDRGAVSLYHPHQESNRTGEVRNGIVPLYAGVLAHGYVLRPWGARKILRVCQKKQVLPQHDRPRFSGMFNILGGLVNNILEDSEEWRESNLRTSKHYEESNSTNVLPS